LIQVDKDPAAAEWVDGVVSGRVRGIAPELIYLEIGNAVAAHLRAGFMGVQDARRTMRVALEVPLRTVSSAPLVAEAFDRTLAQELSVYDACYLVLAEAADAVLVTADKSLAQRAARSALLPGAGPPAG
jgi:predicted nucleic acid-binding protein